MQRLFAHLSSESAKTYGLVLAATGIPYKIGRSERKFHIDVSLQNRSAACNAIARYLEENYKPALTKRILIGMPVQKSFSALFVALVPVVIHWAIIPGYEKQIFVKSFGSNAQQILAGDLFRCVTALFLHVDAAHLLSNVAGLVVFGTAVAVNYGWGVGWLCILLTGAGGNWITALWYQQAHISIGASTAVFAAVGLSAAMTFWIFKQQHERSWRSWTPLAGGLALLGLLGAAPHTDLLAHLFGFISGLSVGLIYGYRHRRLGLPVQFAAAILSAAIVAYCCFRGWYIIN
jgi:membrane associated rhomboid family serine protease